MAQTLEMWPSECYQMCLAVPDTCRRPIQFNNAILGNHCMEYAVHTSVRHWTIKSEISLCMGTTYMQDQMQRWTIRIAAKPTHIYHRHRWHRRVGKVIINWLVGIRMSFMHILKCGQTRVFFCHGLKYTGFTQCASHTEIGRKRKSKKERGGNREKEWARRDKMHRAVLYGSLNHSLKQPEIHNWIGMTIAAYGLGQANNHPELLTCFCCVSSLHRIRHSLHTFTIPISTDFDPGVYSCLRQIPHIQ